MTDPYEAFARAAAGAPQITPLMKADLKKALGPLVAESMARVRVQLASLTERLEWLEERRAADITRSGGVPD